MTSMTATLARLGLVLNGTNLDLDLDRPEGSSGSGEGDDSEEGEESEDESEGGGSDSDEESEDDAEGSESGDSEASDEEGDEGEDAQGSGSDEDGEDEGSEADSGSQGDDEEGQEGTSGDADGEEGDSEGESGDEGDDSPGEPSDSSDGDADGDADSQDGDPSGDPQEEAAEGDSGEGSEDQGEGAGKNGTMDRDMDAEDARTLAEELIDALMHGDDETDLKDMSEALKDAIIEKTDEALEDCQDNEAVWRPYDPALDEVWVPTGGDLSKARHLKDKVKTEISFLRSQLRTKFLQARNPRVVHGVRKGKDLSERRLVNSVVELRSGRRPTRPDWTRHPGQDCSLAAAVVLDESSSMGVRLAAKAAAAALSIAVPLDELGAPCLVIGSRDGSNRGHYGDHCPEPTYTGGKARFHRTSPVIIDLFKDWDEPMRRVLPRFSKVTSEGCTPLSDAIQYAMQSINDRPERHRVIIVLTDGRPDCDNVVRRQIRLAAEAGVHVIGVGISAGCYEVTRLFPTHVAVSNLGELPREMLGILTRIMFPKKGKRIALDGQFPKK